ncbi:MAG: enterotoxin [Candidatus Sulfotelmatobacter sp.]
MCLILVAVPVLCSQQSAPAKIPPAASANQVIQNQWIKVELETSAGRLARVRVQDRSNRKVVDLPEPFTLKLRDGATLRPQDMQVVEPLSTAALPPNPSAERAAERLPRQQVCTTLSDPKTSAHVVWCGILGDDSAYFRQVVTIHAENQALPIAQVLLLEFHDPRAHVIGQVKGSPLTDGSMFFGFEHPLAVAKVSSGEATAALSRVLPLRRGETIAYSSVIGVAAAGQLRRAFLAYLENERPRPYSPMLHYNSWYDLGYGERYTSNAALDRIHSLGQELVEKRHVQLDSFLFDDGWDNPASLWNFNPGFPDGFTPAMLAAARYHFGIGVWLSPWGGYEKEKQERLASGRAAGFEIQNDGFALSGPRYYARFQQVCLEMLSKYGVNLFKFDGTGNADRVFPGSEFDSDFAAAIHLMALLRQHRPDLFINLTTGTYPSPFWLLYADSIWRGGDDHSFAGVGTSRQRWITYRDAQTYHNIVLPGPLFPLNSLMLHGLIYARFADGLQSDPHHDFADEVHSYFGSGTQLQEMYITPSLLSPENWDTLAQAAIWSRQNRETLRDTHWLGGNPARLQVYGWAAWSPKKGIVVLRNPSDKLQSFRLDIEQAFQLPSGAPRQYQATDPWNSKQPPEKLRAGTPIVLRLRPFEVRTMECLPLSP